MTHGEVEAAKAERERDLDRLLTFVDAIAAIAITLLVLPLVELTADHSATTPTSCGRSCSAST